MKSRFDWLLLLVTTGLYLLFFYFNEPVDFATCQLCDGRQYLKLYSYFENGTISQISFPFYTRLLVPLLASIIASNPTVGFQIVNGVFMVLGVFAIRRLWEYLEIKPSLQWVGLGWLLLHWTGIIRYNHFDYVTVDVPLYFVQAITLLLFFRKSYLWFYLITPLALLQKESFLAILLVFIAAHIFEQRKNWFKEGKHLLFSLLLGVLIQKLMLAILPEQADQRNSILALLWHANLVYEDPTRLIRWFAAFGSAFGLIPFILLWKLKVDHWRDQRKLVLLALSLMYMAFGLLAGEDMTRILYLGFPFIVTLSLILFQSETKYFIITTVLLSLVSLRLISLPIENQWGVDYREMSYVYDWALYYGIALLFMIGSRFWIKKRIFS